MDLNEDLIKKHHADLLDEDNRICWETIDYQTREWLEFKHNGMTNYFEKDISSFGQRMLSIGDSIPDLIDEYGERHFPEEAIEDGRLMIFPGEHELDAYIIETYDFKSRKELEAREKQRYVDEFERLAHDGVISPSERASLKSLADSIGLSQSEIDEIENDFFFEEEKGIEVKNDEAREEPLPPPPVHRGHHEEPDIELSRSSRDEKIINRYFDMVRECCRNKKDIRNIVVIAGQLLNSLPELDKEIIGKYISSHEKLKNEDILAAFIKEKADIPEIAKNERNTEYSRNRGL